MFTSPETAYFVYHIIFLTMFQLNLDNIIEFL